MFIVFLLIALVFLNLLFSYLGTHDSTQALPKEKKLVRVRQFLVVGGLCFCMASLLAINSYLDQKRSEATAAAGEQRKADWEVRVEALLTGKCSRSTENNSIAQQCLDESGKRRTEPGRSVSQGRASAGHRSDAPNRPGTAFLRPWHAGTLLTNPFSRPLNPLVDLAPEPKHYSASLVETISSGDKVRSSSGHMGVYPDGTAGGPCMTSECTVIIADISD